MLDCLRDLKVVLSLEAILVYVMIRVFPESSSSLFSMSSKRLPDVSSILSWGRIHEGRRDAGSDMQENDGSRDLVELVPVFFSEACQ